MWRLTRQTLAARFRAKWKQEQSEREGNRSDCDRRAERSVMPHAASHQKRNACAPESREGSGESERTGAAFCGILLGQPESVDREVSPAQTQEEQTEKKHGEGARSKVEHLAEGERDKHHHQRKENRERAAPAKSFRQPRHRQTSENRSKRNQHDAPRSQLRGCRADVSRRFSKSSYRCGNVDGSGPQTADGSQHQ